MLHDFLFELGTEELPSAAVLQLRDAFQTNLLEALDKAQISYTNHQAFATPRRIALIIHGLASQTPAQKTIKRGPTLQNAYTVNGEPSPALLGFAKSAGVGVEALRVETTDKGSWLVHEALIGPIKTKELLPTLVADALMKLPIKKPMRWGSGDIEFVRPAHWVLMLLDMEVLPCTILGLQADCYSYGHRFHAPEPIKIATPKAYETLLEKAKVVADFAKRRAIIEEQVRIAAENKEAVAIMPNTLLDEVTAIVEWPEVLVAGFDKTFLEVPKEVLIAAMQVHQKCFALENQAGHLSPYFVTVSNIQSKDPQQVICGNEKVMCARLSDAAFFYHQDKKEPLSHLIAATANVVFQSKLGSLLDKSARLQVLMSELAEKLSLDKLQAIRAVELSKCDLLTGMVREFPELQGLMGYYYALHDGEEPKVALALKEQYYPQFSADILPTGALGMALSLVDRLDTLVGIFALSQKPSGDKDPFKLRRHALAVARLLIAESRLNSLKALIASTLQAYGATLPASAATAVGELQGFILERLQFYYTSQGIPVDVFYAVKACQTDWLYDFDKRIKALAHFITLPEAQSLAAACKRVQNLLQDEVGITVDESLFELPEEQALFTALTAMEAKVAPWYEISDYKNIFLHLAQLKAPVDAFFDKVMVNVEKLPLKNNRLALLSRLNRLLQKAADISLLQSCLR